MELLAPGGDINSIKAAIIAGADAIYCGLEKFNARNRASNISFDNLQGVLNVAHKNNCKIFVTLNILVTDNEIPALINLLNKLINTSVDGIIVQDLGLFYIVKKYFNSFKVHASTQLTTHNQGQIQFLKKLNAVRVNLSRELNIDEIQSLSTFAEQRNISTEVFIHGSYCISFSGICYMSSVLSGNSGNRGRCSQPCRDEYLETSAGKKFPLNLKDNCAYPNIEELQKAGVYSLKIEGRIKKSDYVFTSVNTYRKKLDNLLYSAKNKNISSDLYKVFNRGFSNSFLMGDLNSEMFIDNPRDNSFKDLTAENQKKLYADKEKIFSLVESKIEKFAIEKSAIEIVFSGEVGSVLKVIVKTSDNTFEFFSDEKLSAVGTTVLNHENIYKRLKIIDDTEFVIEKLDLNQLRKNLYVSYKELTKIKNRVLFLLNSNKKFEPPVKLPNLTNSDNKSKKSALSILISSEKDLKYCQNTSSEIFYQIPESLENCFDEVLTTFKSNRDLVPWFPSVLIGNSYNLAVEFLEKLQPQKIVTNNSGIAYYAFGNGIEWIAGPYLNLINSYSLLCLRDEFNCSGAFISNEINKFQIKSIKKPENFELYYSIYHPIVLMTSRQCLFHQVTGCEKDKMDKFCIQDCKKWASITNVKNQSFVVQKSKGNYNKIYNDIDYLNIDIVEDMPNKFARFLIDLRDIKNDTKIDADKSELIYMFEKYLKGNYEIQSEIKQKICPSTNKQYVKGV